MGHEKGHNARQVIKSLIKDEGWKGFYRGLGPRFFSMSAWGTSMILTYEYLSMDSYFHRLFVSVFLGTVFSLAGLSLLMLVQRTVNLLLTHLFFCFL